jgi:nitroimidazol reductase NimA-like FMN-containing flavoprotein (pyridoxamine 5'-phosphate oxidase superfamily)
VPAHGGELVAWSFVIERLREATAYWLVTVRPDGRPHAMPVWGVFVDDELYLETDPETRKARNLAANPSVVVHPDGADEAVIVEGTATAIRPDPVRGNRIAAEFTRKHPGYRPGATQWEGGGLYCITPRVVFAWRDMPTATRWRFDHGEPQAARH